MHAREQSDHDRWAPGGMYDKTTVTLADRAHCFVFGHDADYGTMYGWCKRCKHTVWTYDHKSVLYYGEYHKFPPPHDGQDVKANQDRAALIAYLEKEGTFWERLWLPLIRWVHRRCTR